jgi:hypothetical protein
MADAAGIFAKHLNLAPLRGRRRGLVRCPFHRPDLRGSLSVDLERGLFHCFTCGAQGGLKRFTELVGEAEARETLGSCELRIFSPRESERARLLRALLEVERLAEAKRRRSAPLWIVSDHVRRCAQLAQAARIEATRFGLDVDQVWVVLELAVRVETDGWAAEADLDALLATGRVA